MTANRSKACHSLVLSIFSDVTDLFVNKCCVACNKFYNALRGIFFLLRIILVNRCKSDITLLESPVNKYLYVMLHMLLLKHQLSVHSYRPFFTMGLSYFLVQIIVTLQLEISLMIL